MTLLRVENLQTWFDTPEGRVRAVDGVSFQIAPGETLALVGESGCGKSVAALSLLQLVPEPAGHIVEGRVWLRDQDLLQLPERDMRRVRGARIAMIFQEPQSSLNPVMTVGAQIEEVLRRGATLPGRQRRGRAIQLLKDVGIADAARRYREYPHQLSGGMKQRVMIAMALAAEPDVLVADEPTTAVDVTIQAQILALLKALQARTGMAILLITHDLGVVAGMADRVALMYAGEIVETAPTREFFAGPRHPYGRLLFRALPERRKREQRLQVIPGSVPSLRQPFAGCRFAERCDRAWDRCRRQAPRWIGDADRGVRCHLHEPGVSPPPAGPTEAAAAVEPAPMRQPGGEPLLTVSDLQVHFPLYRGVLRRVVGHVRAVDGLSFAIPAGRTLALVGESGCGKTTVGKGILQLVRPTAGRVRFDGRDLGTLSAPALRALRRHIQIVFQDPYGSLDPRMRVGEIIAEGMRAQGIGEGGWARQARVAELLAQVGLPADARQRYPHEFSGGQRQRISIARALAVDARLIVCDEPTSALDVSVQAQILNLLRRLQDELGLAYLFITHNLAVVGYLAHEVAVMYLGRIVEQGPAQALLDAPRHPYTQALLAAVPLPDPAAARAAPGPVAGEAPSPAAPPSGCHFHPRCPQAMAICREVYPGPTRLEAGHSVRCHLYR